MSKKKGGSVIEWTGSTWNPFTGCEKISPGCVNCYAERTAKRLRGMKVLGYNVATITKHGWTGQVIYKRKSKIPADKMIFAGSMSDWFREEVRFEWLDEVFDKIFHRPDTTFQILTKRPTRMLEYFRHLEGNCCVAGGQFLWSEKPNPNIWLGVSVENQICTHRIKTLANIRAAVRFISIEPFLKPFDLPKLLDVGGELHRFGEMIHWAIVGPETGPGRRECKIEWMIDLARQLKAAGVRVFVKAVPGKGREIIKDYDDPRWPRELKYREFPEKAKAKNAT